MFRFLVILAVFMSPTLWAADIDETATIQDIQFKMSHGVWVQEGLPQVYDLTEENSCVYQDATWNQWFERGSDTQQRILALGRNVVFIKNGQICSSWASASDREQAIAAGHRYVMGAVRTTSPEQPALGAEGLAGAALIVDSVRKNDELSKTKK